MRDRNSGWSGVKVILICAKVEHNTKFRGTTNHDFVSAHKVVNKRTSRASLALACRIACVSLNTLRAAVIPRFLRMNRWNIENVAPPGFCSKVTRSTSLAASKPPAARHEKVRYRHEKADIDMKRLI